MDATSFKNRGVQTVYRENEAQTIPWEPPYKIKSGRPEVLELDFFKWGVNLPAGRREIDLIEFTRKKKAWEKYIAKIYSPENAAYRKRILMDLEKSETCFREKVLNNEMEERMSLARNQLLDYCEAREERYNAKVASSLTRVEQEKQKRLRAIECKKKRELRKLEAKEKGINAKYHKMTPFEEYCDPKSDFYVNIARFGQNPRYKDENLLPECYSSTLRAYRQIKPRELVLKGPTEAKYKTHNCEPVLEEVTSEDFFTAMRTICLSPNEEYKSSSAVINRLDQEDTGKFDPLTIQPLFPREIEKLQQSAILIQSIIRGRAVQNIVVKGRRRQQDLIDEIKSTHAFVEKDKIRVNYVRALILKKLRQYHYYLKMIGQVAYVHERLTGATLSSLADIAYKEMERIEGERRAHLMADLAERTRMRREAAEGGRRQKEQFLRMKHDEYYKHVMRKTEITTETYLKLLKKAAVLEVSKKEADYSTKLKSDEIEKQATEEIKRELDCLERQEIGARLLHGFYLPQFARRASRRHQEETLRKTEVIADKLVNRKLTDVYGDDTRKRKETRLIFTDKRTRRKTTRPAVKVCKCKRLSDTREASSSYLQNLRRLCSMSSTTTSGKCLNELIEAANKEHEKAVANRDKLKKIIKEFKKRRGLQVSEESVSQEDEEPIVRSAESLEGSAMESFVDASGITPIKAPPPSLLDVKEVSCHVPAFYAQSAASEDDDSGDYDDDSSPSSSPEERIITRPPRVVTTRGRYTDIKLTELAEDVADGVVYEAETRHYTLQSTKESVVERFRASYLEGDEDKEMRSEDPLQPSFYYDGVVVEDEEKTEVKPAVAEHYSSADKWNEKQIMRTLEMIDKYPD